MLFSSLLDFIVAFNWFVFGYFVVFHVAYLALTFLSFFCILRYRRELRSVFLRNTFRWAFYRPVSVLVPAYNEQTMIVDNVQSLLQLEYPEYEIVVINDGSTDSTLQRLVEAFQLVAAPYDVVYRLASRKIRQVYVSRRFSNLTVVDKTNGGKADALNAGINVSRFPLICSIDADCMLERDCLLKVVRPFLRDVHTVAGGGIIRIANGCTIEHGQNTAIDLPTSHLARFQVVEYLRSFLFGRVGLDAINALMITSGAFSIYKKEVVVECGGYRRDSVGEDMELICRIHRFMRSNKRKYRITFVPDPICWTEVPESVKMLARQRNRWQRGLIDALMSNRGMLLNPRYGVIGLFGMPFFMFFEMIGPIIEVTGYVVFALGCVLGVVDGTFALMFLVAATLLGVVLSVTAICLEELSFRPYPRVRHLLMLFVYAILEQCGYRQMHMLWRVKASFDYMRGKRTWGDMHRRGFENGNGNGNGKLVKAA